jgi:hypothetical protein
MNFIPKIEYTELVSGTPKTFTFENPPEGDPIGETNKAVQKSKRSTGGVRATQFNYSLLQYKLEFLFQSETLKTAFDDFWLNHASRGGAFNYFIHSDEVEFESFELDIKTYSPKRPIPSGVVGEFEYDFKFTIERVL